MASELVSIIIPMYGVEEYLPQCLDSVCGQTWQNLEILLIDDESPDRSGEIADEYASRDPRIKVMHIQNRGAAGARNVGLDIASGEYIMFVDSDDWVEPAVVEKLVSAIKDQRCDIAQCQYADEYITGSEPHINDTENGVFTGEEFLQRMLHKWEDILIWNKVFTRKTLDGVKFEEGHCIDDEFFTYQTILKASTIFVMKDVLYHYRQRQSGVMRNVEKRRKRFLDQIEFVTKRYVPIVSAYPRLRKGVSEHLVGVLSYVIRGGADYRDVFLKARKALRTYGIPMLLGDYESVVKKEILTLLLRSQKWFIQRLGAPAADQQNCFP